MFEVRSRAGLAAVTTAAAVLLALPVVAAGQVPVVDQVIGGVTETAQSLAAPAPAPKPAPSPLPPASAPAANPAPSAAPAPPAAPAGSAPATAPRQVTAAGAPGSGGMAGGSRQPAGAASAAKGEREKSERAKRPAGSEERATAAQDDGAGSTDVEIVSQSAHLPEDASPDTLPFTGLQLALVAMIGLAAIASGAALRRGARQRSA
jgi:outer membrane biosynthesis protein TonB